MELLDWLKQTSEYTTGGAFIFAEEPLRVVFCNEAACEQSGYDRRELLDNPANAFFGTAPERESKTTIGSALIGNQEITKRLQNYRKGGRPYLTNLALYPIPCNTDHMRYWIGLKNDLSRIETAELRLAKAQIEVGLFQKWLWNAIEALPDAFVMYDKDDCLVACNDRYKEFYSASADAIFPGANFHDIVCFGVNCGQYPEAVGRDEEWLYEWRERHRIPTQPIERELSGERFIILHDVIIDNGDLVGLQTDVTELRKQKAQLEEQMKFVELLLNRNPAIVLSQGSDWKIQTCSDAWTQQFGYSRDETVGCDLTEFMSAEDAEMSKAFREGDLKSTGAPPIIKTILTFLTKEGERRSVELQPIAENEDAGRRNTIAMTDITPIVRARDELERLAANDELIGLRSRRGHRRRFSDGKREHDYGFLLIDPDFLKSVNVGYGHEAGDRLLQAVADSLVDVTKHIGCAFRLGGEEFAIARPWDGWHKAGCFAERIRKKLEQASVLFQDKLIQHTASIGYTEIKKDDELSTAMHLADRAQQEAKASGRNKTLPADTDMLRMLERRGVFIGIDHVQAALEAGEVYYDVQPIVHSGNDRITGFEGLYVGFNFILEENAYLGAAEEIGNAFGEAIRKTKIPILIETSERAFHLRADSDVLIGELNNLRDMGFIIALYDFGVESSNIQRLQQFPIDVVKLDRSPIRKIVDSERQRTTVFSIARMIESLGLTCIVEGVETEQQAQMLQEMGLVVHQGFFHALPMLREVIAKCEFRTNRKSDPPQNLKAEIL